MRSTRAAASTSTPPRGARRETGRARRRRVIEIGAAHRRMTTCQARCNAASLRRTRTCVYRDAFIVAHRRR